MEEILKEKMCDDGDGDDVYEMTSNSHDDDYDEDYKCNDHDDNHVMVVIVMMVTVKMANDVYDDGRYNES